MITIKTKDEIEIMAQAGKILATVLKDIEKMARPGVTTLELDGACEALILSYGAKPAFKGYEGFKHSLCASVNENVVHGVPSGYVLKEGDVIGLDLGVLYKGYYSDMAVTVPIGKVSNKAKKLIDVSKKALEIGIKKIKPGTTVGDIGSEIQKFVEGKGFSVVKDLCGHGIGKNLHEDPKIPNFGNKKTGEELEEGMVICIEPMVTAGSPDLKKSEDGYGFAAKDGSLTAHFEHTIAVTKNGARVLTD